MPVAWNDLLTAFTFLSGDPTFGNTAWVSRETGKIFWHAESGDCFDELPEDIGEAEKYIRLANPRDLDLGSNLVMRFAADRLADRYDEVADIFSRKGAYRRFKDYLRRIGALESWHEYENEAQEKALREWCAENGVDVGG